MQRQILQAQLDAQEITIAQFEAQLGGLNVQEGQALSGADALAGAERDNLARTTNNLLQNAIQRAEFRLSGATSEQGFETRRQELITAIGEFYDAEEQRISQLSLSEAELQNLREDNTLARQLALGRVMTTENRFTTERIRAEETAQAEIERLRDEAIEREERRQQEIQDLKDEALEAEKDRQEALVALEEETQEKITDIQRKAEQKREDIEREFNRDFEDNFRNTQEKIAELLSEEGFGGGEIRDFLSGFEGDIRSRLSDSGRSQLRAIKNQQLDTEIDSRRERDRDLEDVGIRERRQVEDANIRQGREAVDINEQTAAELAALQQETVELESQTAALQQQTATVEAEAATQLQSSATEQTNAAMLTKQAAEELQSAARVQGLTEAADALSGAAASLDSVTEDLRGVAIGLGIVVSSLIFAAEGFGEAIEEGTLNVIGIGTQQVSAIPTPESLTEGISMGVSEGIAAVSDDIYDPARIEELRGEGFNNREIGQILRETAQQNVASTLQQDVAPTSLSSETLEQAVSQSGAVPVHVVNIADLNVAVENMVSVEEHTGIVPVGVPVGGPEADNRLFHFAETDAIANRLARQAAFQQPRRAPNYLPDANQIRNSRDVSREIVSGLTEGLSQRNSSFGNEGAREQPQTIVIENKMQMPSGVVKEISRERIILNEQGDFLDV